MGRVNQRSAIHHAGKPPPVDCGVECLIHLTSYKPSRYDYFGKSPKSCVTRLPDPVEIGVPGWITLLTPPALRDRASEFGLPLAVRLPVWLRSMPRIYRELEDPRGLAVRVYAVRVTPPRADLCKSDWRQQFRCVDRRQSGRQRGRGTGAAGIVEAASSGIATFHELRRFRHDGFGTARRDLRMLSW